LKWKKAKLWSNDKVFQAFWAVPDTCDHLSSAEMQKHHHVSVQPPFFKLYVPVNNLLIKDHGLFLCLLVQGGFHGRTGASAA
jgi:hypothetical protein